MCGIAGVWYQAAATEEPRELAAALQLLDHRGPDDEGVVTLGPVQLGHRRLAIIDTTSAGHQPLVSQDGRYGLVFNGEIYNYRELRAQLPGVIWQSHSDTEVLLQALIHWGPEALARLRGMFAFGFWDMQREELMLARDPFGKKPLFYSERDGVFRFGSEPKVLLVGPVAASDIDQQAATRYWLYEYPPAPHSIWRTIQQVPAGSYLIRDRATETMTSYWQPRFTPKAQQSEDQLLQRFDELLGQAVARRLVADVPVGIFLSGGLDSTTIGWYMAHQKQEPGHSFSMAFEVASFDESTHARQAARALGFQHHEARFGLPEFVSTLTALIPQQDMPLADASLLPTYHLSEMARQHVTVVLDGDGSDELLGGYGTFAAALAAEQWGRYLPVQLSQMMAARLPTRYGDFSLDFKIKMFVRGLTYTLPRRNQVWLGSFTEPELTRLLMPAWQKHLPELFGPVDELASELESLSTVDQVSGLTLAGYLHNDILVKLDRATMYASLEARTPFLDIDLAEFLMQLPERYKRDKYLLKQLMRGRISDTIIQRRKKGFGIPLGYWLRGPLRSWSRRVLATDKLREDGVLAPEEVERLLTEHAVGRVDHRKKLWTLLTWQLWYDHWVAGRPALPAIDPDELKPV